MSKTTRSTATQFRVESASSHAESVASDPFCEGTKLIRLKIMPKRPCLRCLWAHLSDLNDHSGALERNNVHLRATQTGTRGSVDFVRITLTSCRIAPSGSGTRYALMSSCIITALQSLHIQMCNWHGISCAHSKHIDLHAEHDLQQAFDTLVLSAHVGILRKRANTWVSCR
jgi:hypothetical protein